MPTANNLAWSSYRVLVVGAGSIGQRHMRNLRTLGIQHLAAYDSDGDRLAPLVAELGIQAFGDFKSALRVFNPEIVFVCTPPVLHASQALQALAAGAHIFVEKPLATTLADARDLVAQTEQHRRIAQVGYNLRFNAGLQKVKELVDAGSIGRILWACAEFGQYLPDWRPWQDYRKSYSAQQTLGGGVILDVSHELDYVIWLLGKPTEVLCMAGKVSDLEVDVEDCATVLLRFANGAHADVHIDCVQRGYSRSCKLAGERGTITWDYVAHQVQIYRAETKSWDTLSYSEDGNDMYLAEVRHFLECVDQGAQPLVDIKQASLVLKVALAAKSAGAAERTQVIT